MKKKESTTAKKHTLKCFTQKTLESTKDNWRKHAGADEFETEYGLVFEWAAGHIDYAKGSHDSLAYGLFSSRSTRAAAIVEVIQRSQVRKGLTKMLKIWITPEHWDASSNRMQIASLMVDAMLGTIELSTQNRSKTVKIYGRTEQMLSILHTVHTTLSQKIVAGELKGVQVNIVDRWLEIKLAEIRGAK